MSSNRREPIGQYDCLYSDHCRVGDVFYSISKLFQNGSLLLSIGQSKHQSSSFLVQNHSGLLLDAEQRSNQTNTNTSTKDGPMRVKLNEDNTDRRTSGEDDDMLMQRIQKYLDAAEKAGIQST
ncbi:hypothetical protein NPIL_541841 [Nephila pilipes]|uniref:Uncharacterized protein n=1 Tax=Nephila pilipes TaxID=299642 RepID=A0A8X6TBM7_NEPPI|nr:hypothetical protein NPIL_541841 [Nephila pilipes]